jgi:DNA repair exonuclease SbcCD nuclease subunit
MKRLIFSDTHFHPFAYGASVTSDGFNSRIWAQFGAAEQMIDAAEDAGVKYAYFAGDLFHQHGQVPTQALMVAAEVFRGLRMRGIKIRAIPGNHDQLDRQGKLHALTWLPEEETYADWCDDGLVIHALPYTEDDELIKRALGNAGDVGGMILLHQGVSGVPISSGIMLDERLSPEMIPDTVRAFTGHYHFHKAVTPNLTVIGNLTPLNWSDIDQEKGWVIWDDETGALEQQIQTAHPGFISFSYEQDLSVVEGNFVRYTTAVEPGEQEGIREDLIKNGGALTVEFPVMKMASGMDLIQTGGVSSLEQVLEALKNRDMPERRREVGVEIREKRYPA